MGRTSPTSTQLLYQEEEALARFRRALYRRDQLALDDLFVSAHQHRAALAYAGHLSMFESILLAMLLEEHKKVLRLERLLGMTSEQSDS